MALFVAIVFVAGSFISGFATINKDVPSIEFHKEALKNGKAEYKNYND